MPAHKGFNKVKMQSLKGKIAVITGASSGYWRSHSTVINHS
jgi:hypothetical protein